MVRDFESFLGTDEELIVKKLEYWARNNSDKTFIYYGEEKRSYSYGEFNQLANRVAHGLIEMGIQKGDRISLFLKNPLISAIAMFGIWKAGAIYCPINFNYKGKLLSYQINDTNPKLLIIERSMIPAVNDIASEIHAMDVIVHNPMPGEHDYDMELSRVELVSKFNEINFYDLMHKNILNPNIELHYWDIANIVYTSGTTGPAKGVVQSYRWIHQYNYSSRLLTREDDVIYNDLPFYHVGGAFALLARGVFAGCTVAIWDKFSTSEFWNRIEESGATFAILLSVMIPWLMKAPPSDKDRYNTLNKVYMQPLPEYHHDVAKRFGIDFVFAGYGQTESGNGFKSVIDELEEGKGTPPELWKGYSREELLKRAEALDMEIRNGKEKLPKGYMGSVSSFLEAKIVNEHDEECLPNVPGEIVFRPKYSHCLLEEYFNNPKATLECFKNLWFHTGDIGYKDENGTFYFVDRMNDVIRHKGENISSYQIEDIINKHEQVSVCAAFPIPAEEGNEDDIVVYIVPKDGMSLEKDSLMEWITREMPKFMWPKHIRFIDSIPRTPTNKIEKYKLKEQILKELKIVQ